MAGIIGKDIVIEDVPINKAIDSVADHVALLNKSLRDVLETVKQVNTQLGGNLDLKNVVDAGKKGKKAAEDMGATQKELLRLQKEVHDLTIKIGVVTDDLNKKRIAATEILKRNNEAIKEEIFGTKAEEEAKKKAADNESIRIKKFLQEDKDRVASDNKKAKELTDNHNKRQKEIDDEIEKQRKFEQEAKRASITSAFKEDSDFEKAAEDATKRAIVDKKLLINAQQAEKGSVQQLSAVNDILRERMKSLNILIPDQAAKYEQLNKAILNNQQRMKEKVVADRQAAAATKLAATEEKLKIAIESQAVGSIKRLQAENQLHAFTIKNKLNPAIESERAEILRLNQVIGKNKDTIATMQRANVTAWERVTKSVWQHVAAYIGFQQVVQAGKEILNQTRELDQLNFSMATVIKSSVEFANTQKFLSEVAVNYGGDLLTLSERYIKFRAAAMQSNISALETQKIFGSVSKAAGVLGLKTDELSGVYLALEQMISKGKVTTEELRRQLGERLPGAFGIMANALGVTVSELDKMLKKGEIISSVALPKFAVALERAYGIENVKKIDTLAAAQGRLSTEITGLIKEMQMSDNFKSFINGLASSVRWIKDNINLISSLTKILTLAAVSWTAFKISVSLANLANKSAILSNTALTLSTRLQVVALSTATKAWTGLKVAISTNPVGFIISAITTAATALLLFSGNTKEVTQEIQDFNKESSEAKNKVKELYDILGKTAPTTNIHKEALNQLNDMSLKYNTTLQTENGLLDKNNTLQKELTDNIDKQLKAKYRISELDAAQKAKEDVLNPIKDKFIEKFKYEVDGYNKALIEYSKFLDLASDKNRSNAIVQAQKNWGTSFINSMQDASKALNVFSYEEARIKKQFGEEPKAPNIFDLKQIKDAEAEFKKLEELNKANKANKTNIGLEDPVYSIDYKSFKEYLLAKLKLADEYANAPAVKEAIGLALGSEKENKPKGNQFTPLEKLQDDHKRELSVLEKNQLDKLGAVKRTEKEIEDLQHEQAIDRLTLQKNQLDLEINLTEKESEKRSDLLNAQSEIEKNIAEENAKYRIKVNQDAEKKIQDDKNNLSQKTLSDTENKSNLGIIDLNNQAVKDMAGLEVLSAKDSAQKRFEIEQKLFQDIQALRVKNLEEAIKSGKLNEKDAADAAAEIIRINKETSEKNLANTKKEDTTDTAVRREKLQQIGDMANEGFNFGQQIFSNELDAAKKRYDDEIAMAGDNVEAKIIADRKYEEEQKKIRRKQDIADKAQAIFNIGLTLAMATAKLNAFQIIAATLAIATVLAKPVPQYFKGKVGTPETFIAGDAPNSKGASELVELQSGESFLTPDKPTLFSDPKFKGATVFPHFHDKTQRMLNNYGKNQGASIFVDMSKTNKHLETIAQNTKGKEERFIDAKGRQFIKRGSITTQIA